MMWLVAPPKIICRNLFLVNPDPSLGSAAHVLNADRTNLDLEAIVIEDDAVIRALRKPMKVNSQTGELFFNRQRRSHRRRLATHARRLRRN
jgi:hypothetical protein